MRLRTGSRAFQGLARLTQLSSWAVNSILYSGFVQLMPYETISGDALSMRRPPMYSSRISEASG
jgi:hypothetical protein